MPRPDQAFGPALLGLAPRVCGDLLQDGEAWHQSAAVEAPQPRAFGDVMGRKQALDPRVFLPAASPRGMSLKAVCVSCTDASSTIGFSGVAEIKGLAFLQWGTLYPRHWSTRCVPSSENELILIV